jgi:hypothetical protein
MWFFSLGCKKSRDGREGFNCESALPPLKVRSDAMGFSCAFIYTLRAAVFDGLHRTQFELGHEIMLTAGNCMGCQAECFLVNCVYF